MKVMLTNKMEYMLCSNRRWADWFAQQQGWLMVTPKPCEHRVYLRQADDGDGYTRVMLIDENDYMTLRKQDVAWNCGLLPYTITDNLERREVIVRRGRNSARGHPRDD